VTDFDADAAINIGGWDPRCARVLDVQVEGDVAAALVDANGDGADINIDIYVRSSDGEWNEVASGNSDLGIPGWQASSEDDQRLVLTRTPHDQRQMSAPTSGGMSQPLQGANSQP
jgi:hypothetical protein